MTVGGVAGGTITSTGTLGLDGWQIAHTGFVLEPQTTLTASLGDSSHVISNANLVNLLLYNSSNAQTIKTSAHACYTWTTPVGNPTTLTSLLTVSTSGALAYSAPSAVNPQVLTANSSGTMAWTDQCSFAGLNNTVSTVLANTTSGLVINDTSTATNCLKTLLPDSVGAILTINSSGIISWLQPAETTRRMELTSLQWSTDNSPTIILYFPYQYSVYGSGTFTVITWIQASANRNFIITVLNGATTLGTLTVAAGTVLVSLHFLAQSHRQMHVSTFKYQRIHLLVRMDHFMD